MPTTPPHIKPAVATITSSILLILLIDPTFGQANTVFDPDLLCPLIANGTKIKDPRYCNTYIICMNNTSVSVSCGDQFYDRNSETCVDPDTIKCLSSNPCQAKDKGFVADPYACSSYYYCENGVGTRGECSSGLNFNPETENCLRNYPCDITMYPEDYCNIVPDGVFIGETDSCSGYQTCWKSSLINGTCPSGFYFNAFVGACDYPQNVDCVEPTTPPPPIPDDVKCTTAGEFISDGQSCDGYYYCDPKGEDEFDMIHGNCPVQRFFDATNGGQCLPRANVTCSYNRCVTLGLSYMQMANINEDGCTGFSICQYGQEIAKAACPSGQYFDELSQLCVDEPVTYAACALPSSTTPAGEATTSTSAPSSDGKESSDSTGASSAATATSTVSSAATTDSTLTSATISIATATATSTSVDDEFVL